MNPSEIAILEQILSKGSVPALSPLAIKLVDMASGDEASASDLSGIIEKSPGLTARLLKLVNSAGFSRGMGEVTSIERAVVILGLREIRIMALSLSLRDTLPLKKGSADYKLYWRNSMHRAVIARELAKAVGMANPGEAFVAGLLSELGLPLLLSAFGEDKLKDFPGMGASLAEQTAWERSAVGLDHRLVGEEVLRRWGLPQGLLECQQVMNQKQIQDASELARVSDLARIATESLFLPSYSITDLHQKAKETLGLETPEINSIIAAALSDVCQAADVLEVDLDHESDMLAILEKANQALSRLSTRMEPPLEALSRLDECGPENADRARLREDAVINTLEAVAHEIRNPLMSVGGFARRLAAIMDEAGRAQQYAEVLVNQAARLDQVLSEMVASVSPYHPKPEVFDLRQALGAAREKLPAEAGKAGKKAPEVSWRLPETQVMMEGDLEGLSTAFAHMIAYAAGVMKQPDQEAVMVSLGSSSEGAVILITFTGGMTDEKPHPLADKTFGPELGLAKARRIIEGHGGTISTRPHPGGQGLMISTLLPVRR